MGKHDLKFFASTLGGLAVLLGIGGHGIQLWMRQNPGQILDSSNLESIAQLGIYSGTAIWVWALSTLARSRGFSTAWSITGGLMLLPLVGLIPWFIMMLVDDNRVEDSDKLMVAKRFDMPHLDAGAVHIRFAGDLLDRDLGTHESVERPYDPWSGGGVDAKAKSATSVAMEPRSFIKRDRPYRW